jgi:hypothetical protein
MAMAMTAAQENLIREEYRLYAQRPEYVLYWAAVRIEPVSTLARLRKVVLSINAKRRPKWRFRLADEIVLQLQPQPNHGRDDADTGLQFLGRVLQGPGITKAHFASKSVGPGLLDIPFSIDALATSPVRWRIKVHRGPGPRGDMAAWQALKDRLIASLPRLNTLEQTLMFQPNCVICGKALTDPVSIARWIGPECAHSHGLDVGIFRLTEAG